MLYSKYIRHWWSDCSNKTSTCRKWSFKNLLFEIKRVSSQSSTTFCVFIPWNIRFQMCDVSIILWMSFSMMSFFSRYVERNLDTVVDSNICIQYRQIWMSTVYFSYWKFCTNWQELFSIQLSLLWLTKNWATYHNN